MNDDQATDEAQAVERPMIGRASATERDPNTSDQFAFWLGPGVRVNPFDIVEAEQVDESRTFGLVLTLEHRTDAPSHLSNFISNDFGELTGEPNTLRQGTTVARAGVLSNDADIYMPVPNEQSVRFADEAGIHRALGIDEMLEERRIPAGLIEMSNGTRAVAYIDLAYVLGPEAAHVNISGISGLATKTSYGMFLIQSILQSSDASDIAVIILNVKHGDLLMIDRPEEGLEPEQHERWDKLGLEPRPFENVHYLLPHGKDTLNTGMPNSFIFPDCFKIYAYALDNTYNKLDLLFSQVADPSATIESMVGEITNGLEQRTGKWADVTDWDTLLNGEPLVKDGRSQRVGDIHASSVGKFRRHLRRIVKTRTSGLFVRQLSRNAVNLSQEIGKLQGGHTYVVDIAKLTDEEQTLVFGDILRTVYALYAEEGTEEYELPKKVIIFVDELNKYAPAREGSSPILDQVLDIAERGRSLGVILISAQQFMSAVHGRVTGNAATLVVGRSGSAELAAPAYRFLDTDVRGNLTRLSKGELLLSHSIYRQPVKIIFPKPAFKQQT
ncbi:MAG: ATP-binding protein [Anaerolineae bacterium]